MSGPAKGALRGDITWGDGVYKSTDGGKTWTSIGLKDTRQIGALIVDPSNPDVVLVAAEGHAFGPNAERGVFRTTDGGKTWTKVLYKDENTGAVDVTFDPTNPKIVYAALWQARRQPWNFSSGGPGSGLYRSTDGGVTWTELKGNGLPEGILGRIDVSVSAGRSQARLRHDRGQGGRPLSLRRRRPALDARQRGRPHPPARLVLLQDLRRSEVGRHRLRPEHRHAEVDRRRQDLEPGRGHRTATTTRLWIDPANPRDLINASDGGATVSLDGGKTWSTEDNQPTAQFYHVAVDNRFPYWVYGAQQDNTNLAVASFADEGVIGPRDWYPAGGGESGFVVPDPRDADIIYSDAENSYGRYVKSSRAGRRTSAPGRSTTPATAPASCCTASTGPRR